MYNIRAAAFFRLITNIETQNAFMNLLDELRHVAWFEFSDIGTTPSACEPVPRNGQSRQKGW
jgi:hypothetical protein